jgi:hypothetical protein
MKVDPKTHLVVDMSSGMEVKNAVEVDENFTVVTVRRPTYDGDKFENLILPAGVKVVRRR